MNNEQNRIIPLTDNFMKDQKIYDKVWSYLQTISYLTKDKKRIVYKNKDSSYAAIHRAIAIETGKTKSGRIKYDISSQTVSNTMKLYIKLGMIEEGKEKDKYGKTVDVYILKQDFETFQYVPMETLRILINTVNFNTIKVYAYLLDKYEWKKKTKEKYIFTLKELAESIGYSDQRGTPIVKDIIFVLSKIGLIEYKQTYNNELKEHVIPIHVLEKVNYKI